MRLVPLLVLVLALAACGSEAERTGVPASSSSSQESAEGSGTAESSGSVPEATDEPGLKPPPVLLVYKGQEQKGVRGAYCVDYVDPDSGQGEGICVDGPVVYPDEVTSVAAGDRVTFVLPKARVKGGGSVAIRPLGCTDEELGVLHFRNGARELEWKVDLEWGAYQLDVLARFEADDGRSGDVGASLGLTVAGPKTWDALGVRGITDRMPVCDLPG